MSTFITSLLMPIYLFLGLVNPVSVGSTITTINGTDTLSSSRTTINDNFTSLNNGKLEQSNYFATTSLPSSILASSLTSIGTITSGTWSGTAIAVAKGGTGTTSPTSNQVMLGNGSSGFKVVNGFGSSGQFLTSNGDASAPTWQTSSVALGDNYTWTGGHMWTASSTHSATTTISASSVTNNALVLNTVPYSFPSTQTSGYFMNDGSGVLSWKSNLLYSTSSVSTITGATGQVISSTIPANTLMTANVVKGKFFATWVDGAGATIALNMVYDDTTCATTNATDVTNGTTQGTIDFMIIGAGTNSQRCTLSYLGTNTGAGTNSVSLQGTGTASEDQTTNKTIVINVAQNSAGETLTINGGLIEVVR